jgi:hypothetical protein
MTDFGNAIDDLKGMLDGIPGCAAVFEGLESGDLTTAQAYVKLEDLLRKSGQDITALNQQFPMKIPTEHEVPMVLMGDNGLPMLNPLVEAKIAELSSIDGDVPSMRTGPLPENATPALPVETTAANPVMVGMMLEKASKEIHKAIQLAVSEREKAILLLETEAQETGLAVKTEALPALITGVDSYRAGSVPAPLVVAAPTGTEMAALTPTERRTAAHKAIATTQGRASLAPVIGTMLTQRLGGMGISAGVGVVPEENQTVAWAMHTYADDELHEDFSPVEAAVGSLAAKLKAIGGERPIVFTVLPVNGVSERHFGWAVRFRLEE